MDKLDRKVITEMRRLFIDIETFSNVDLTKCGVYKYVEGEEFEVLLFAYAFDDEEVKVIDLKVGEKIPREILSALISEDVVKTSFNANFERVCLEKYLGLYMNPKMWSCTAVLALGLGLKEGLKNVSEFLNLENGKMEEGKDLIRYFSIPSKKRNLPKDNIEKWNLFKEYCIRDVEVLREIRKRLDFFTFTEKEKALWELDQRINDRGILVDEKLISNAIYGGAVFKEKLLKRGRELTGLSNFNSVTQLKGWLASRNIKRNSLSKEVIDELLEVDLEEDVKEVLNLRKNLSKTSIKKYEAMERGRGKDNRIRGLLKFYGASRTGRWAGRLVQVQNLPQNKIKDLDICRRLLLDGDYENIELFYGSFQEMLKELIRTAFIPKKGCRFIVADYSAIEARVIAFMANEKWRTDIFNSHGKIYEESASRMFRVPIDKVDKNLRAKGKIAELALGYGGSVNALEAMGALKLGIKKEELLDLVSAWRRANPYITKFWWDINKACIKVIKEKSCQAVGLIKIYYEKGIMFIKLPSGRALSYINPRIEINDYGLEGIVYEGIGKMRKWEKLRTYGPKLVENIVQAISRDLLGEAMINLEKMGYEIVMHVHDEIVIEKKIGEGSLEEVYKVMEKTPKWIEGLSLKALGFESEYYKKE